MLTSTQKTHLQKLKQKKYRKEYGEFVIDGIKGVEEALKSNSEVLAVIVEGNRRDEAEFARLIKLAEDQEAEILFIGRKDIVGLKNTETFPGVQAIVQMEDKNLREEHISGPIIVLDRVADPGNLGTIIRTADWFGIKNIILSEGCVDLYNDKVVRSTMGSFFRLNIFQSERIVKDLEFLKGRDYQMTGLVLGGEELPDQLPSKKSVYIFGSESHGISEEVKDLLDKSLEIVGKGGAESLNVAISAAICISRIK